MKKIITIILALAMAATMSTVAFAETVGAGTKDIDVSAKYAGGVTTPTVISVDVTWGDMEFTYNVGGTQDWNAENHQYTANTSAHWTAAGNEIKVTNHSNAAVKATFAFTADEAYNTVTGSFTAQELSLPTAVDKSTTDSALTKTTALTLGGTIDSSVTNFAKVGKVTVTIAEG